MKRPTLKQLKKRPALWWASYFDEPRITYPDGSVDKAYGVFIEKNTTWDICSPVIDLKFISSHKGEYKFLGWL